MPLAPALIHESPTILFEISRADIQCITQQSDLRLTGLNFSSLGKSLVELTAGPSLGCICPCPCRGTCIYIPIIPQLISSHRPSTSPSTFPYSSVFLIDRASHFYLDIYLNNLFHRDQTELPLVRSHQPLQPGFSRIERPPKNQRLGQQVCVLRQQVSQLHGNSAGSNPVAFTPPAFDYRVAF